MDEKYKSVSLCTAVEVNNLPERQQKIRSQSTNAQNQPSIAKALHTVTAIFDSNKRGVRLSTLSCRISVQIHYKLKEWAVLEFAPLCDDQQTRLASITYTTAKSSCFLVFSLHAQTQHCSFNLPFITLGDKF